MDDEQLKRHIIAKRLLRRARQVLQIQVDQESFTSFSKATNLAAAIDIFFATEPAPGASPSQVLRPNYPSGST